MYKKNGYLNCAVIKHNPSSKLLIVSEAMVVLPIIAHLPSMKHKSYKARAQIITLVSVHPFVRKTMAHMYFRL